jgi:hypothetical protein
MSETPSQLDAFLSSGAQPEGAETPAPEPPKATPEAAPDSGGSGSKDKPPAAKAAPEPEDDEPGEPEPGQPNVPRSAYEKERQRRQDWKSRASAAEAEKAMLLKQLEEARKPPPQSTPPAMLEPIDPARDPEGYTRRVRGVVLNERLNTSEMMALDKHGKEVIDAETEYFQRRTQDDPRLWNELYSKPHPYQWMIDNNATARLHEEIGTDPAAYRARIAAEERAKWEAEGGAAQRVSPAAGLPPSLASARSAAPRGTNGFAGPPSLSDILARPARRG